MQRLRERTGIAVEPKQAWTDVARLAVHGIPAANLGPRRDEPGAPAREWVQVEALARGYDIYERFLSAR